jgi:hypothetical protein
MKGSIEIIVSPTGEIQIDAVGFKGTDCNAATKFLEKALGTTAVKQTKPEYHQPNRVKAKQRVGE